ncbi:taurine ABC transporter substrate-binding protein [Levilactobacillus namurensis]|uniref:taurine ABC transporter substrate-binding protein n=1 Tax=Levilactobacillus namurensis TaxID=380393 RepID=UPI00046666E2|nr:ABC transporter substrate-binding protein [Levilactobacillus namurensis]
MSWKKWVGWLGVLCLGVLGLGIMTGASHPSRPAKVLRIGILRVPNDVAAARQRGDLQRVAARHGYRIKYYSFDSGVDANKALMANSVDLATMGDTNAVVAMAAKIPVKLVWVNDVVGSNEQLVVKQQLGIQRSQDLAGKTIATPFASTSHYSLMMYLKMHHLLGKVRLLDMQTTEIVAAWRRGDIDGAYTWEPSLSNLTHAQTLTDSRALARTGHLTANVTLATNQFRRQHPQALRWVLQTWGAMHTLKRTDAAQIDRLTGQFLGQTARQARVQIGTARWVAPADMATFMTRDFTPQFNTAAQFMGAQQTLNSHPTFQDSQRFIDAQYCERRK